MPARSTRASREHKGNNPRINANAVIRIGRRRAPAEIDIMIKVTAEYLDDEDPLLIFNPGNTLRLGNSTTIIY